ncbi:uncharacterized protein LOC117113075 [Anneissia japonica]|uniref:uncharacterized protein LOC117113075 n=1 Tax=Anneissia japonica TaxID=1529436 RepID=UPI0014254FB7|nr:uncharacterized protein LOC117113075 [Anneissia japonica]
MCLGGAHQKEDITSCRTQVLLNGRPSVNFDACQNAIKVSNLGDHVFKREADDDRIGMSIEDNEFLDLMNHEMEKDKGGNWEAPLPFRFNRSVLPNNKSQAESRMKSLIRTLEKKPVMKTHYFEFMEKILQKGHAERVNDSPNSDKECWYLPHFGVYHSQKPEKIRVVFDSSAEFQGISLNSVLLSGPDLVNQLLGVLIRFRENPVAVMADVEQMFYAFKVKEQHRDYLRFLWFEDNDPDANLVTYRMKVHIFGNRPSPAVATLGLRRTAKERESEFGSDARAFVESNFYVDDGLKSFASAREAVDLLTRTRNMLATANIKLHKIASNDKEVMAAFAPSDLAPNVQEVDLGSDAPVMQRSLGVYWDMRSDTFTYKILQANGEPSTKRAVLSEINSVYDPLGFAGPVIIEGKMLLREIIGENKVGWDEPLPQQPLEAWKKWRSSINELSQVNIPRAYTPFPAKEAVRRELHIFGDASSRAISAVSYLRSVNKSGKPYVSFVLGKSKLAPKAATTIPRMELCAAVLGTEVSELAVTELDLKIDAVYFYTDSKVVMGYITNRTRRFYLYVSNRVARILRVSKPEYWKYIPTAMNPADVGSRSIKAKDLQNSPWLQGPTFLHKSSLPPSLETDETNYDDDLDNDPEVRNTVSAYATEVEMTGVLESHRFNRFSSWLKLLRAIASLILLANKSKRKANVISDKDRHVKRHVLVFKSLTIGYERL